MAYVKEEIELAHLQRGSQNLELANTTLGKAADKLQSVCKHFAGLIQNGMREYSNVKQSGKKTILFLRTRHQLKVTLVRFCLRPVAISALSNERLHDYVTRK